MTNTTERMKQLESKIQISCVKWFRKQYPKLLLFAIPNGGQRNVITASIIKAEGAVSGVADLQLLVANKTYHSLFIEMKQGKNKQSDSQLEFEKYCIKHQYQYEVCRSVDEFIAIIDKYLSFV